MISVINIKGDKSITHRIIMLSSIISNDIIIKNPSNCIDVLSTIDALNLCGANIIINNNEITNNSKIHKNPSTVLDCGNSGTTARLLIGLLFGMGISATIDGDSSLRSRPMDRVLDPLESMNLKYQSLNKKLPIHLYSSKLNPANSYTLKVASAQVKSSILFASFNNPVKIIDKFGTRDHTERMFKFFKNNKQHKIEYIVPGDISNAAFIICAGIFIKDSNFLIKNVLFNESRNGFINVLKKMNADIFFKNVTEIQNEKVCDILVRYNPNLIPYQVSDNIIVKMIDEIPILAVVYCFVNFKTSLSNLSELRIKESDRISEICSHLNRGNVDIIEKNESLYINPDKKLYNTINITSKDHRIIMACEVFNLIISKKISKKQHSEVDISFPDFYKIISNLVK